MPSATRRAPGAQATPTEPSNGPQSAQTPQGGTLVAAAAPHTLALPAAWAEKLAAQAKDVAAAERPSLSRIGLRAGVITYGGNPVKGNKLNVIVLAAGYINVYYVGKFDPNNLQNPNCFAVSEDGEDMEAHELVPDSAVPENDPKKDRPSARSCEGCIMNAWGSAGGTSRGKACKEKRRLVLLPEDAIESAEAVMKAEMAVLDLPVTSGKNYSGFVNGLAAAAGVPPWAAVTVLGTEPDPKSQFKVTFTPISVVQDVSVLEALEKRLEDARRIVTTPYDEVASTESGKMQPAPASQKY